MRKLSAILIFMVLLAACGGADEPAPSPTEAATTEPAPTETAVSEPTATVEPIPTEVAVVEPTAAAAENEPENESVEEATTAPTTTFQLEAWADNWFAAYLGEELIVEDSVSIMTERSFNAETGTFEASYPLNLNFILKDFKENDSGLEYIGTNRQQMGDGGFIMQLTDVGTGEVVVVSNADWVCTVIHEAPLDKSCENESNPVAGTAPCDFIDLGEPDGWKATDYDDSSWTSTTVHSASDVSPKFGYDEINWDASAALIWGPDLETNNTILCRVMVEAP